MHLFGTAQALQLDDLAPATVAALVGAIEECLENVRRHAGVEAASLVVEDAPDGFRCVVSDEGRGFDVTAIGRDRLGLSESVRARVADVQGRVIVWSTPGSGTTVILTVPKGVPASTPRVRGSRPA